MPTAPHDQLIRSRVMTRTMRRSSWWRSFRDELAARGIDPDTVTLVDAFDDEPNIDVGLIFSADQRLVAWRRRYFENDPAADEMLEWQDVTETWPATLWHDKAKAFLAAQRSTRPPPSECS